MEWDTNDIFCENVKIDVREIEDRNPDLYVTRSEEALKRNDVIYAIYEIDKAIKYAGEKKHHYIMEKIKILQATRRNKLCATEIQNNITELYEKLSEQDFFWILRVYEGIYDPSKVRDLIMKKKIPQEMGYLYRIDGSITDTSIICLAQEISRDESIYEATTFLEVILKKNMSKTLGMELIEYLKKSEDYAYLFFWYEKMIDYFNIGNSLYPELIQLAQQKGSERQVLKYCEDFLRIDFYNGTAIDIISEQLCKEEKYSECATFLKYRIDRIKDSSCIGALHKRLAWSYDMIGRFNAATIHYLYAIRHGEISRIPKGRPTRKKILLQRTILCIVPILILMCIYMYTSFIKSGVLETNYTSVMSTIEYSTLLVGEEVKLETTYQKSPSFGLDGIVTYKSITPDIITVEQDGTLKALSAGIGTIEVYINNKLYESITVDVENAEAIIIHVVSGDINGEYQETFNIYATVEMKNERSKPEDITYRSTDTSIAEVDSNGKVTLVGYGRCRIQLKAGKCKKEINVHALPRVNKVLLNGSEDSTIVLEEGDSILCSIEANTSPEDVFIDYELTILNEYVAVGLDDGTITALRQGDTQICIEVFQKKFYFDLCVVEKAVVTELKIIEPEGIDEDDYFNSTKNLELIVGESQKIKCEISYTPITSPEPEIEYTVVEDESGIISFSEDGVIYGMKPGTAELHIESREIKEVIYITVVNPPISRYQIDNLKAKYLSDNQYELSWDVIDDYPDAVYRLYVKQELVTGEKDTEFYEYDLLRENSTVIEVLPNCKKIEVKVCGVFNEESKPSNEVILTQKETPKFDFTLKIDEYGNRFVYCQDSYLDINCSYKCHYREKGTDELFNANVFLSLDDLHPDKTYEIFMVAYWRGYAVGETDIVEFRINQ